MKKGKTEISNNKGKGIVMTIGECLSAICEHCLGGNVEEMTQLGLSLISDLKYHYFLEMGDYPRKGWTLYFDDGSPVIFHSGVRVPIKLEQRPGHRQLQTPVQKYVVPIPKQI